MGGWGLGALLWGLEINQLLIKAIDFDFDFLFFLFLSQ